MSNRNYLFNLRKIPNINNNNQPIIIYGNSINKINDLENIIGPTGPCGTPGDRFATKTECPLFLRPSKNTTLIFRVEPGLAYISGNSVIVSEVGDNINSELNTFEGTIQFYSAKSGEIVIKEITNIKGEFGERKCYYNINLDGVDGAMGEQGPIGPTGPSCISDSCDEIYLVENTIIIPNQNNHIAYYKLLLNNNCSIENIECNLKNNQQANIIIKLNTIQQNLKAMICPINGFNNNYIDNIIIDNDKPYVLMTINKISTNIFNSCSQFYNDILNIKI